MFYRPGGGVVSTAVTTDTSEFQILDASVTDFLFAPALDTAEKKPTGLASSFSVNGYTRYVVTISILDVGGATTFYLASRQSGLVAPDITAVRDWSYYAIDNIDPLTGISDTPPYQINIPLPSDPLRRYTRSFRVWGSWAAPVVWCDGAGALGYVYAQRFVGG